ncbi:MAG: cell division protein FtsZ [Sphingobacteriales bacterium]|jgi:cell division protein FtsZ
MKFEMPKEKSSIIKVLGVGGGGSNAVNHMYNLGISGVDFIVANTDAQALDLSPVPNKIHLGANLTEGRGAGSMPEVGRNAALESAEELKEILGTNTKMIFVTAGMGGGTGTGAGPVIAEIAKELDVLTVGIVTLPFSFEGKRRKLQADEGIAEFKKHVDALLVISNDKLRDLYGNLSLSNAFSEADSVLSTAAKGIAEIITVTGYINVDFEDVKKVMKDSGVAIMGSGTSEGEGRAIKAAEMALSSPLLNDNDIIGAENILLNITSGRDEITMDEISTITDYIQDAAGMSADLIWGNCIDESLGDSINVTLIATGFKTKDEIKINPTKVSLDSDSNEEFETTSKTNSEPISRPIERSVNSGSPKNQVSIFDDMKSTSTEKKIFRLDEEPIMDEPSATTELPENAKITEDRISKLKNLSMKINSPQGLNEMENVPAYKRRNIDLEDVPHSSESSVEMSRKTLSEGEDNQPEIRGNNSFLHDQVD